MEVMEVSEDIFCTYLLDRSGSMVRIWDATVEGFNGYKNDQANQDGVSYMSLITFDGSSLDVVYRATPCSEIPDMDPKGKIRPRGSTPLLDAIGTAVSEADKWVKRSSFTGKVLIVINTDGQENASIEYTLENVRALIKQRTDEGWEFAFMGAGIDAFSDAKSLGIGRQSTMSYDATADAATTANMNLSSSTSSYRQSGKRGKFNFDNDK